MQNKTGPHSLIIPLLPVLNYQTASFCKQATFDLSSRHLKAVVFDASRTQSVDANGIAVLLELFLAYRNENIPVSIRRFAKQPRETLERYGLGELISLWEKAELIPPEIADLSFINRSIRGATVITMRGMTDSDDDDSPFVSELRRLLDSSITVILDLAALLYLDARTIEGICKLNQEALKAQKKIVLCQPGILMQEIFDQINVKDHIDIFKSLGEALNKAN